MSEFLTILEVVSFAEKLALSGERKILGITGAPGAGKSTLTQAIVKALGPSKVAVAPMDGFHLSNQTLMDWQMTDRKGAWDTFDVGGFVALLNRLRNQKEQFIHAPDYYRSIEESIGSAIPISLAVPLILTEGNYLLSDKGQWTEVWPLLDESWYVELDEQTRIDRLIKRHIAVGKSPSEAEFWSRGSDQVNAIMVQEYATRATRIFSIKSDSSL